jgi:DNA-binding HxlR family transcriptional regulator
VKIFKIFSKNLISEVGSFIPQATESYQMDTIVKKNPCPLEVTIAAIGGKWKCVILWWLRRDPRRFGELKLLISTISQKVLTQQLRELEMEGLISRESYPESPPRVEYFLTPYGKTLTPITELMCEWGKHHNPNYEYGLKNVQVLLMLSESHSLGVVLEKSGAIVETASSISSLKSFDVLLVDFSILNPEDSQMLMSKVKEMEIKLTRSLAMVAVLPINNSAERGRACKMGFAVHLPSPVDHGEMIATIARLSRKVG